MGKVKEGLRSLRFSRRIAGRAVDRKRGFLATTSFNVSFDYRRINLQDEPSTSSCFIKIKKQKGDYDDIETPLACVCVCVFPTSEGPAPLSYLRP